MNRLIAPTLLGVLAGAASAQSSVTLFGAVDLNARYVKADGQPRRVTESNSGLNASQIGLRGLEDLGSGFKAGFLLAGDMSPDLGTSGDNARNKFWNRQSFMRVLGPIGEIRLGRDFSPSYQNIALFEVTGNVGLGGLLNIRQMYGGARVDNSVSYLTPVGLAGIYGSAMVGASEGGTTNDRPGRYLGIRGGYASGNIDIAISGASVRFDAPFAGVAPAVASGAALIPIAVGEYQRTLNAGASYNFGVVKVYLLYDREILKTRRESLYSVSANIPFEVSEIHVGYAVDKLSNGSIPITLPPPSTLKQFSAGYIYNLSKRTALYTTVVELENSDASRVTLPTAAGTTIPGGKSRGIEAGIRHFF